MKRDLTRTKLAEYGTDRQSKPAISKGIGTILIGDLNRPLNNNTPSFGTNY